LSLAEYKILEANDNRIWLYIDHNLDPELTNSKDIAEDPK
jgi:hypothetical protein